MFIIFLFDLKRKLILKTKGQAQSTAFWFTFTDKNYSPHADCAKKKWTFLKRTRFILRPKGQKPRFCGHIYSENRLQNSLYL